MNYSEHSFRPSDFLITSLEVGRCMGYPDKEIPVIILEQIEETKRELLNKVDIRGGYGISDCVAIKSTTLEIDNIEFNTKKIISRSLNRATSVAVFVCTIGETVSNWTRELVKNDAVKGYIADVSASLMTEKVAERIQHEIMDFATSSLSCLISNRYSPGYCGWPVSDQHQLFSLLPDNFCGIKLNEAALMHPIKSVSGIIGIGKDISVLPYPCNICSIKDCIMSLSK